MGLTLTKNEYVECPHYTSPRYYVDPKTDKGYEGPGMCELVGKYCIMQYGLEDCEEFENYLKELKEER